MKLLYVWLFLQIFFIANLLFSNTAQPDLANPNPYSGSETGTNAWALWNLLVNPSNWSGSAIILFLTGSIIAVTAITVGAGILTKFDIQILFPIFIVLLLTGAPALMSMYQLVNGAASQYMCNVTADINGQAPSCFGSVILGLFSFILLGAAWLFVCIEWWTNRPTT